jgi:hypothetical protein
MYQVSNWIFVGMAGHEAGIMLNGKLTHRRIINSKYGTSDQERAGGHGPWRSRDRSREIEWRRN